MVLAYLDIETYSPGEKPRVGDKVILIYYKEELDGNLNMLSKEWEEGEDTILQKFYDMLKDKTAKGTVTLIGWNFVRFDIPFLTCRLFFHKIDSLDDILETFRRAYFIDLRQCLLPFNKYRFKGLSEEEIAKKFKIEPPKYSNKKVKIFYEKGEYKKIEEHAISEMKFLSNLAWKMRDIREVQETFTRFLRDERI
ncbi:MAG: ribonuclease H-like domain-containing protein [candidate division WOR-3 bacterium]